MMPMHPPIMVGVDGSKHAEYALKASIQMAKFRSAKLVITSVYSYPPELGDILGTPDSHLNEASIRLKKTLNGYREQAFKAGVKEVEIKVLTAFSPFMNAGAMLVIEAEKMGCGMIVVGTKGATGIEKNSPRQCRRFYCEESPLRCLCGPQLMESALFGSPLVATTMAKKMPEEAAGKLGFSPFSYLSSSLESSQNPFISERSPAWRSFFPLFSQQYIFFVWSAKYCS